MKNANDFFNKFLKKENIVLTRAQIEFAKSILDNRSLSLFIYGSRTGKTFLFNLIEKYLESK